MNNKAQINQVFVWIVVALVIGGTALFGVRSIGGILEDKCSVDLIRFEDKLLQSISLNNDFGSVNAQTLTTPCDYTLVCLVDARAIEEKKAPLKPDELGNFYNLISSSIEDGVEANVFIFNQKELIPAGYISQLRLNDEEDVPEHILCIESRAGRIKLILEGLGRNTYVREDPN